jgi:hypothetical protein
MKITRRQFGTLATTSAAGLATASLVAPGSAMAQTNMFEGSLDQFSVTPPEDGKNWHPLAAHDLTTIFYPVFKALCNEKDLMF